MQIQIRARNNNLRVDERLQDYVQKRLGKLDRYLPNIKDVHVDLATEHHRKGGEQAIAQLTVRNARGAVLRAEDKGENDIFAAVDRVVDKMYRQISRYKGKLSKRGRMGDDPDFATAEMPPIDADFDDDDEDIVRRKEVELVPMNEDEAIDQMELLGHDFFMFYNATTGSTNVVYRRKGGGYGLLQPVIS